MFSHCVRGEKASRFSFFCVWNYLMKLVVWCPFPSNCSNMSFFPLSFCSGMLVVIVLLLIAIIVIAAWPVWWRQQWSWTRVGQQQWKSGAEFNQHWHQTDRPSFKQIYHTCSSHLDTGHFGLSNQGEVEKKTLTPQTNVFIQYVTLGFQGICNLQKTFTFFFCGCKLFNRYSIVLLIN